MAYKTMSQRKETNKSSCGCYHAVNPLLSPPWGAYLFQAHLRGGGEGGLMEIGGLFNLEKTMVSVVHKELEYEVEKLKYKKNEGHAAEDQNQI